MLDKLMTEETALFCGFLETFCDGLNCKDCCECSESKSEYEQQEEDNDEQFNSLLSRTQALV